MSNRTRFSRSASTRRPKVDPTVVASTPAPAAEAPAADPVNVIRFPEGYCPPVGGLLAGPETSSAEATAAAEPAPETAAAAPAVEDVPVVTELGPAESIEVPLGRLRAALLIAAKSDVRYILESIYLSSHGNELRITASDGHRLLIASQVLEKPAPSWLEKGVMLPREQVEAIVGFISKKRGPGEAPATCVIEYGIGHPSMRMHDGLGFASFQLKPLDGEYINTDKVLGKWSAAALAGDRAPLSTTCVNPAYLAAAGKVAVQLESEGVFPFIPDTNDETSAQMFTFAGAPGVILYIMPMRVDAKAAIAPETVRLIGRGGIKLSVAALKAHATRAEVAARKAKGDERKALEAKARSFTERAEELLANLKPALPAPGEAGGADTGQDSEAAHTEAA